jgi:diguanylate cyclase (GGDEF)-like protein/PAS domain S-box-containing protein
MPEAMDAAVPDLTEILTAAQDLAYYNRSLIEACPDPVIAVGADGRITDANRAFLSVTGMPREKLVGSDFASYFTDPELARAGQREAFSRGFVAGYPLAVCHASGKLTHLLCNGAPYRNRQDEVAGVLLIAHDVSQQKQRDDELARLHANMTVHVEELKQHESEIKRISELYETLQTCNSEQEAYPIVGSVAGQLFPKTSGALAVSVSRIHQMETVAEWGTEPRMAAGFLLDDCWALRRGQMQEVTDSRALQTCGHFQSAPAGPYICLPLTVRGDLQGLLNLRGALGEPFGAQERQLLTTLGDVIKLSLSNLKLRAALRTQAIRDPLTGLFNRNYLDETLRRELSRSARRQAALCVAVLDIDGFKGFNDTYSHHAGDVLLKALGGFFLKQLRTSDIVCRYGGDEFVLVLPDTDLRQVAERLDRIRAEFKNMECMYEGRVLPAASVSIGVAQWPDHGASAEDLIKAADFALYSAKHSGRDQVSVFGARTQNRVAAPDSTGGRAE